MESKRQRYYDYVIASMVDDTKYTISDENESIVVIRFPMYGRDIFDYFEYRTYELEKWAEGLNKWSIGTDDRVYLSNLYGVNRDEGQMVMNQYSKLLGITILRDLYGNG